MKNPSLTQQYLDGVLPDGWYYFSIAGTTPQIGKYLKPSRQAIDLAEKFGAPTPSAKIASYPGLFIGQLTTVEILAQVPSFEEFSKNV